MSKGLVIKVVHEPQLADQQHLPRVKIECCKRETAVGCKSELVFNVYTNFTNFAAFPRRNSPSEKYIISLEEYVQCTLQNSQNTQNPKSIPCTRGLQCREKLSVASTFVPGNMARMIPSLDESLIHFGELPGYGKIPSANSTSKQRTKEKLAGISGGGRAAKTYGL